MEGIKTPKIEWILKECPFCGGEASLQERGIEQYGRMYYDVHCLRCGAGTRGYSDENRAAAAWDERLDYKNRDKDRTIKAIQKKYNEAKKNECIKDPLGYALYYTWKDREREKVK